MGNLIEWGYWGLFVGSFLASTIVPFSSDVLMVGMLAAGANIWKCLAIATIGNWLGGMTSYGIGWIGNADHIERWFKVKIDKIKAQKPRIDRFGALIAFVAWLPVVGDLFAIALGFFRVRPVASACWMLLGRFVRFLFWALLFHYQIIHF